MSRIISSRPDSCKTDIRKRDSSWTIVRPGLYIDPAGYGHIFPDEVIAELSRLYPEVPWNYEEDYGLIVRGFLEQMGPDHPVEFIEHIREKD